MGQVSDGDNMELISVGNEVAYINVVLKRICHILFNFDEKL